MMFDNGLKSIVVRPLHPRKNERPIDLTFHNNSKSIVVRPQQSVKKSYRLPPHSATGSSQSSSDDGNTTRNRYLRPLSSTTGSSQSSLDQCKFQLMWAKIRINVPKINALGRTCMSTFGELWENALRFVRDVGPLDPSSLQPGTIYPCRGTR